MKIHSIKRIIILLFLFFGPIFQGFTQDDSKRVGVKGGFNLSNFYVDEVDDQNPRYGIHFGLFGKIPVNKFLAFQPELLFSTKGATYNMSFLAFDWETQLNMNYVELPLLAVIRLSDNVDVLGGVYGAYLLNVSASTDGETGENYEELDRDNFQPLDFGLAGGIEFKLNPLILGVRYHYGLNGIGKEGWAENNLGDAKNSALQLSAGFAF
ncbi:porin family protein [Salinivirga cyanobacteriivorans]